MIFRVSSKKPIVYIYIYCNCYVFFFLKMILPLFELEEDSVPVIRLHTLPSKLAIDVRTDFRTKGLLLALFHGQDGFDRSMVFGMHWEFDYRGSKKMWQHMHFHGNYWRPVGQSIPNPIFSMHIFFSSSSHVLDPGPFSRFDNTLFRTTFGNLACNRCNTSMKKDLTTIPTKNNINILLAYRRQSYLWGIPWLYVCSYVPCLCIAIVVDVVPWALRVFLQFEILKLPAWRCCLTRGFSHLYTTEDREDEGGGSIQHTMGCYAGLLNIFDTRMAYLFPKLGAQEPPIEQPQNHWLMFDIHQTYHWSKTLWNLHKPTIHGS